MVSLANSQAGRGIRPVRNVLIPAASHTLRVSCEPPNVRDGVANPVPRVEWNDGELHPIGLVTLCDRRPCDRHSKA